MPPPARFPALRPEPKAVDEAPLIDAPVMEPLRDVPGQPSRWALAVTSAVMLAGSAVLIGLGRRSFAGGGGSR